MFTAKLCSVKAHSLPNSAPLRLVHCQTLLRLVRCQILPCSGSFSAGGCGKAGQCSHCSKEWALTCRRFCCAATPDGRVQGRCVCLTRVSCPPTWPPPAWTSPDWVPPLPSNRTAEVSVCGWVGSTFTQQRYGGGESDSSWVGSTFTGQQCLWLGGHPLYPETIQWG